MALRLRVRAVHLFATIHDPNGLPFQSKGDTKNGPCLKAFERLGTRYISFKC